MSDRNDSAAFDDACRNGIAKISFRHMYAGTRLHDRGLAVQELISRKPGFLLRWGVTIFLFLLMAIMVATWFIQYPDVVNANAQLTSLNAPKAVMSRSGGQLVKLFAKEGESVKKDAVLGYMESTADPETILALSSSLDTLQREAAGNGNMSNLLSSVKDKRGSLGELQQPYQTFTQALAIFRGYLTNGFYVRKRSMLFTDLLTLQRLNTNLLLQKSLQEMDLDLAQQTFSANEKLKSDSVISAFDYRNEWSKLISKRISLPQLNASLIFNEGQQNEKKKEIMELENQIAQQKNIFVQALHTFISQVDEWKKKYLLTAPVQGRIAFPGFVQEHQQLPPNQIIFFVDPGNSEYYAEMYVSQFNLGKVKAGQEVLLKFPSYPFEEYGSLKGYIEFISTIPSDSGYLTKVALVKDLTTVYKKHIQYREGLVARAEIITQDRRLLERLYYNIVKQVTK